MFFQILHGNADDADLADVHGFICGNPQERMGARMTRIWRMFTDLSAEIRKKGWERG
jgi:hypothetical protein